MSDATVDAQLRTRAFARVIGPFVAIVTTIVAIRLPDAMPMVDNLFANPALVWMLGAFMLVAGLVIIASHRNWRGAPAIAVSLFGWFVGLRGLALMATTDTMQNAVEATTLSSGVSAAARVFFVLMAIFGLWLTYVGWISKPDTNSAVSKTALA